MDNSKTYIIPAAVQRLQAAASTDETRYNIGGVYLNSRCAVATDGHRLAITRMTDEQAASVPHETLIRFSKGKQAKTFSSVGEVYTVVHGRTLLGTNPKNTAELERHADTPGFYPQWRQVLPKEPATDRRFTISLSMKHLRALSDALGRDDKLEAVTLGFDLDNPLGPVVVTGGGYEGAQSVGIIMPVRDESDPWAQLAKVTEPSQGSQPQAPADDSDEFEEAA